MHIETLLERRPSWLTRTAEWAQERRTRVRWMLLIVATILIAALLPSSGLETLDAEVGRVWQKEDRIAEFDFPIVKSAAEQARERTKALAEIPDPFLAADAVPREARASVMNFIDRLDEFCATYVEAAASSRAEAARAQLEAQGRSLSPTVELPQMLALVADRSRRFTLARRAAQVIDQAYHVAFIDQPRQRLRLLYVSLRPTPAQELLTDATQVVDVESIKRVIASGVEGLPADDAQLLRQLLTTQLRPNYRYSVELLASDRAAALAALSPHRGVVSQGQTIVRSGQRISPEVQEAIRSYVIERNRREGIRSPLLLFAGQVAVVGLLIMLTAIFLRNNRREIWNRNRKVALLLFTFVLMAALNAIVMVFIRNTQFGLSFSFLVPMSMAAIMLTVFFDDRVGFFANIIISLLAGLILYNSFESFFIQVVAGSVAVSGLTILRRRSQIFTAALALLLGYWGAYLAYNLALRGSFIEISYGNLVLFALNVLITLVTYPLIYLIEKIFGVTSDLTYLELLDTDHPLLKELSLKAPGTYQHSMQVANIAEHVATQIGANALQVRVAALFHDVGKIYQPDFFIENQQDGYNPHRRLDSHLSAEIIINHVDYGVELAKKNNLPPEIIDFIRSHHGTSRVEHFYRTYVREHPDEVTPEADFRYKGPRPRSKEQAILMLADSCEAASRSLTQVSDEALHELTEAVIAHKIADRQLDEARISFRDVDTIRKEIIVILRTIYHSRITSAVARTSGQVNIPSVERAAESVSIDA
jgi:putative nucleotidyltransferase with HDIG domain